MAITLVETDTAKGNDANDGVYPQNISPFAFAAIGLPGNRLATSGGTAGSTAITINLSASDVATDPRWSLFSGASEPNNTSWVSGDWVVRFEVTTSNMNVTWDGLGIAAVDVTDTSRASQIAVAASTTVGVSCSSTGVKSTTIAGSAISPSASWIVQITFGFTNGSSMVQSIGVTPSQNIDTPISQGSGSRFPRNPAANFQDPAFL